MFFFSFYLAGETEHDPTTSGSVTCMAFNKAECLNGAFIERFKCPSHLFEVQRNWCWKIRERWGQGV